MLESPRETLVIEHNTHPHNKKTRDTTVLMDLGVTEEMGLETQSNRERGSTTFWASAPEYTENNRNGSQCVSIAIPARVGERNFS